MEVSKRIKAIASLVSYGNVVCDVGCDHGYLSIYLIENNIAPHVIAMDVAKGPLERAVSNIKLYGMTDKIETRLSDGVKELKANEADSVVIAGMGGMLIANLLTKDSKIINSCKEIIVSPHTDVAYVRGIINDIGFVIVDELMLIDENKSYNIIKAVPGRAVDNKAVWLKYGKVLLENQNEILKQHLTSEYAKLSAILDSLKNADESESVKKRIVELNDELMLIKEGLGYYET